MLVTIGAERVEQVTGKCIKDITRQREDMNFIFD